MMFWLARIISVVATGRPLQYQARPREAHSASAVIIPQGVLASSIPDSQDDRGIPDSQIPSYV